MRLAISNRADKMRKGFAKEQLNETFIRIGAILKKPMDVFLLGGGAMCFRNQKNATKDIDLVFKSRADYYGKT